MPAAAWTSISPSRLPELSRTRIQELIDRGQVRVGERLSRSAHRIAAGDAIEVEVLPRPPLRAAPEEIPIEVLLRGRRFRRREQARGNGGARRRRERAAARS